MDRVFKEKENCYGCTACENICPKGAISMQEDEKGFNYPEINTEKCTDCGMCEKVCPYNSVIAESAFKQRYYAVQHNNTEVVFNSSSGGFFSALSDEVLNAGGVVYGVGFDEAFVVRHSRADDRLSRDKFMGSKYVQSDMSGILSMLLNDLNQDRTVLFTGTPCQVAGVTSFVLKKRKSLDGLILCDFICHGTSSPRIWKDYVKFLEKAGNGLKSYAFRGKKQGWHQRYPIIHTSNGELSEKLRKKDSFLLLYQTCFLNRDSCYMCKYATYDRVADITIGDFWNIGKISPKMDDNRGTSEVLVNSAKGLEWFEKCKTSIRYVECMKEDVWQPHLEYPNAVPQKRDEFWKAYNNKDFTEILSKYGKGDFMTKMKNLITPIAKKVGIYVLLGKLYRLLFVRKENVDGK